MWPHNAGAVLAAIQAKQVAVAFRFKRPRIIVFLNFRFAAVVTWNPAMIVSVQALASGRSLA
jgi:hypothetical protein